MVILIRYGEIGIKGKNRGYFERALAENIKDCLKKNDIKYNLKRVNGRILVYSKKNYFLKNVFGIVSFSNAIETEFDLEKIKKSIFPLTKKIKKDKAFRVTAKRVDKSVNLNSIEINKIIGEYIKNKTKAKVSLKDFDYEIGIEIIDKKAYLFNENIKCFGGLPVGVEGNVLSLIEDNSSLLASLLLMRRGCKVHPVSLKSHDISILKKYSYGYNIKLIKIKRISEIKKILKNTNSKALVLNTTLDNFDKIIINVPILEPLISFNKKKIKEKLNEFY